MKSIPFLTAADAHAAVLPVRAHLERDGVLGHPTETVYGLGGRATPQSLAALFRLKGRDAGRPVLLLVASRRMAEDVGLIFGPAATALADVFWPGPLTLVLPARSDRLPAELRGPSAGIGVRWTAHQGMVTLIAALGYPLTSTSANAPGADALADAGAVAAQFGDAGNVLLLDGGTLPASRASTVVDCTSARPGLIREGAISMDELKRRAGQWAP
jgi:L-threonylcarbamoyladenylate synthase